MKLISLANKPNPKQKHKQKQSDFHRTNYENIVI